MPTEALRSAARARRRVESSVGSAEFASFTMSGNSVHPRITQSQPSPFMRSIVLCRYATAPGFEHAVDQLGHDDAVDLDALGRGGPDALDALRRELPGIDVAIDEPARARNAGPLKPRRFASVATTSAMCSQGNGERAHHVRHRLVDRVVGTDEEIRARLRELPADDSISAATPSTSLRIERRHVLGERVRMHRHFRMIVRTVDRRALDADRAIAERRALRGAGDDADVQPAPAQGASALAGATLANAPFNAAR